MPPMFAPPTYPMPGELPPDGRSGPFGQNVHYERVPDTLADTVQQWANELWGRPATAEELEGFRRVAGLDAIRKLMMETPEAKTRKASMPTAKQANTDLLTSLDDATLAGYMEETSTPEWWASVQGERARRQQAAASTSASGTGSTRPAGLPESRGWIWDAFHDPRNKNPIRDPNETDYQYWEGKKASDPNYDWVKRMLDREGEGSNAGHFPTTPAAKPPPSTTPAPNASGLGQTLYDLAMGTMPQVSSLPASAQGGRGLSIASQPITRRPMSGNAMSLMDLANVIQQYR